jgi:hypothetical protein
VESSSVAKDEAELKFKDSPALKIAYDSRSHLPIAQWRNSSATSPQMNLCVNDECNQNLSPSAKCLLQWHFRFGHRNFSDIQRMLDYEPFGTTKFLPASNIPFDSRPKCEICEYAKAHRRHLPGKTVKVNKDESMALKKNDLRPGSSVSSDHFESRP